MRLYNCFWCSYLYLPLRPYLYIEIIIKFWFWYAMENTQIYLTRTAQVNSTTLQGATLRNFFNQYRLCAGVCNNVEFGSIDAEKCRGLCPGKLKCVLSLQSNFWIFLYNYCTSPNAQICLRSGLECGSFCMAAWLLSVFRLRGDKLCLWITNNRIYHYNRCISTVHCLLTQRTYTEIKLLSTHDGDLFFDHYIDDITDHRNIHMSAQCRNFETKNYLRKSNGEMLTW